MIKKTPAPKPAELTAKGIPTIPLPTIQDIKLAVHPTRFDLCSTTMPEESSLFAVALAPRLLDATTTWGVEGWKKGDRCTLFSTIFVVRRNRKIAPFRIWCFYELVCERFSEWVGSQLLSLYFHRGLPFMICTTRSLLFVVIEASPSFFQRTRSSVKRKDIYPKIKDNHLKFE